MAHTHVQPHNFAPKRGEFATRSSTTPHVALCVFGTVRGFTDPRTLEGLRRNVIEAAPVADTFLRLRLSEVVNLAHRHHGYSGHSELGLVADAAHRLGAAALHVDSDDLPHALNTSCFCSKATSYRRASSTGSRGCAGATTRLWPARRARRQYDAVITMRPTCASTTRCHPWAAYPRCASAAARAPTAALGCSRTATTFGSRRVPSCGGRSPASCRFQKPSANSAAQRQAMRLRPVWRLHRGHDPGVSAADGRALRRQLVPQHEPGGARRHHEAARWRPDLLQSASNLHRRERVVVLGRGAAPERRVQRRVEYLERESPR